MVSTREMGADSMFEGCIARPMSWLSESAENERDGNLLMVGGQGG